MIRLRLPRQLLPTVRLDPEMTLQVEGAVTLRSVLDAAEAKEPILRGTLRDPVTGARRPFIRFFIAEEDYSNLAPDDPLPDSVASGQEVILVIGAIAGG